VQQRLTVDHLLLLLLLALVLLLLAAPVGSCELKTAARCFAEYL
jgi:hypothetical protein